jgi:hypothetical protein
MRQEFWEIVNKASQSDAHKAARGSPRSGEPKLEIDIDKIADTVLALTLLCDERIGAFAREKPDRDALNRLCERGYLVTNSTGAVALTKEGEAKAEELFWKLFGKTT